MSRDPTRSAGADVFALDRYERMLAAVPSPAVLRVHAVAFARLTAVERMLVRDRLTAAAQTADERPAGAAPAQLARPAVLAERRRAGGLARAIGFDPAGSALAVAVAGALLDTVSVLAARAMLGASWRVDGAGRATARPARAG
jgi:hypothetical protein